MPAPSEVICKQFVLRHPTTRVATDADSLPTAILIRNGLDTAVTCTVTKISTGVYKVCATIPSTYVNGDEIEFRVTATVAALTQSKIIRIGEVEARTTASPAAVSTDWKTNLENSRANYAIILAEITAAPKMSYSIDGQSFSWTEYQRFLLDAIKAIDDLLLSQEAPYEERSMGYI